MLQSRQLWFGVPRRRTLHLGEGGGHSNLLSRHHLCAFFKNIFTEFAGGLGVYHVRRISFRAVRFL